MNKNKLENINKRYPSKKDKPQSEKSVAEFRIIEDRKDLSLLASIAAQGTKKVLRKQKRLLTKLLLFKTENLFEKDLANPMNLYLS